MITTRDIVKCILLYYLTCGIYGIFWYINLTDETNYVSGRPTASGGMAFLFSILTCRIYNYYWAFKLGEKLDMAKSKRGMMPANSAVLYLVLVLFKLDIVVYGLAQNELNDLTVGRPY